MDDLARLLIPFLLWASVGLAAAVVMARRGHDLAPWVGLGIVLGPLVIPLAVGQARRAPTLPPPHLEPAAWGGGHVDVLIGIDGSDEALLAASQVLRRLGPALRRVTLAAVTDLDESLAHRDEGVEVLGPDDHVARCDEHLDLARARLVGVETGRVVLSGAPAEVLERYAADEGYDFVVVGPRGHGASKLLLGSVASRLSRGGVVPVIVGPQLEPDTTTVPPTVVDRLLT